MDASRIDFDTAGASDATVDEVWLLGQPPLEHYLDFVRDNVVGGTDVYPAVLVDEWREANDYYYELEQTEAGIADRVECRDLDSALIPLAEEVMAHPHFRNSFDILPTSFGMVELDRLVLFQIHVARQFIDCLKSKLGPAPDPETVFRFCLPLGRPAAPVRIRRVEPHRYVFSSESMDLRFHEEVLLRPDQLRDYHSIGAIAGVFGVVVGFSSNFLSVVRSDDRLILHNGYHRACALRELGITHAPCVIETVTRRDELNVGAKDRVADNPAFYLKAARPPLLKDFFDPKIRKVLRTYKRSRMIEVRLEVQDFNVRE